MKKITIRRIVPFAVAFFLFFLFCHDPISGGNIKGEDDYYKRALKEYREGFYQDAILKLESLLKLIPDENHEIRARTYLLLGACYEKNEKKSKAGLYFLELRVMCDKKLIAQVPVIDGLDPEAFAGYRDAFANGSFFTFKEPVPVSEMVEKNVVHAPRKSVEQKEQEKKKKKFPWLIAVGAVVVLGTAAVLLLGQRKKEIENEFQDIQWIRIPAGEFSMGDHFNEGDADELPVHQVSLDEYYISKYEITVEQYNYFCGETGATELEIIKPRWTEYTGGYPAVEITYDDAKSFCQWLSDRTGKNVRLPTEAQWEKAARGGEQYRYPWGNDAPNCNLGNYSGCYNPNSAYFEKMSVGTYSAGNTANGICDMAGNVWEWCRDWYDASYYAVSPKTNPQGPSSGTYRVIRGGSFRDDPSGIRSANREYLLGEFRNDVGFRVVYEPGPARKR